MPSAKGHNTEETTEEDVNVISLDCVTKTFVLCCYYQVKVVLLVHTWIHTHALESF